MASAVGRVGAMLGPAIAGQLLAAGFEVLLVSFLLRFHVSSCLQS